MLEYFNGNIFEARGDPNAVLVCPVNCIPGVLGAGLAKHFKREFPDLPNQHRTECLSGNLKIGKPTFCIAGNPPQGVILFPTKDDWRNSSKLEYIEKGLGGLLELVSHMDLDGLIILPALGCGLGGLNPKEVFPLFEKFLRDSEYRFYVCLSRED